MLRWQARIIRSHEMRSFKCDLMICACQHAMIRLFGSSYCSNDFIIYPHFEQENVKIYIFKVNRLFQMIYREIIFCAYRFHCDVVDIFNKKRSAYALWCHQFQSTYPRRYQFQRVLVIRNQKTTVYRCSDPEDQIREMYCMETCNIDEYIIKMQSSLFTNWGIKWKSQTQQ
jgi:hypothetical protein